MPTLSRLWMPAGSSGYANSIGDFIFNIWLVDLKTVIGFHLLKHCWKRWLIMMFIRFFWLLFLSWNFLCCPSLNLFLLTEITASTSVSPLLAAKSHFSICFISYLHQCLQTSIFRRNSRMNDTFILCIFCTIIFVLFSLL